MRLQPCLAIALLVLPVGAFAVGPESGMERYFPHDFLAAHGPVRSAIEQELPENPPGSELAHAMAPPPDPACQWFEIAAEQGDAEVQLQLATCLENGKDGAQAVSAAMAWYEKAAMQGMRDAQRILGIRYLAGAAGSGREETGLAWLRQAVEQGDAFAKALVDYHASQWLSPTIEAIRVCHQKTVAALDDGAAAPDTLAAAVQARCAAAMDAWIHVRFPESSRHGMHYLREGALAAERSDVAAMVAGLRTRAALPAQ